MTRHLDHRTIETAMRQARVERAHAFRRTAERISAGLRTSTRAVVGVFA